MREKDILAYHYPLVTGIQSVRKYAPRIIATAQLPLIVLFADELETVQRAAGMTMKYRTIRAVLFAQQWGMGSEDGGYVTTDPFFDLVDTYFEARQTLGLADGTTDLIHEYQGDQGETATPYPTGDTTGANFWTITFVHRFTVAKEVVNQSGV